MIRVLLFVLLVGPLLGQPEEVVLVVPDPKAAEVEICFDSRPVTPTQAETSTLYRLHSTDSGIYQYEVEGLDDGETVTICPVYDLPGGNSTGTPLPIHGDTSATTITSTAPDGIVLMNNPNTLRDLYLEATTTDTTGCTLTVRILGW